ncbi:hypothetical protein MRB53_041531 [Persea americana]|nr:hypothetical protein MRB53_041531 [Persea americana]
MTHTTTTFAIPQIIIDDTTDEAPVPPPPGPPPLLTFDQIRHLATHGWLPLTLPDPLASNFQELFAHVTDFFAEPLAAKQARYPPSRGTEFGFYHVPEEKEFLTFRHRRVHTDSVLEDCIAETWRQIVRLLYRVLADLSTAAGYDPHSCWDHMLDGVWDLAAPGRGTPPSPPRDHPHDPSSSPSNPASDPDEDIPSLFRLFQYYPGSGFATAHVDIGLVTLCVGNGSGLQVQNRETHAWHDATGPTLLLGETARCLLRNQVRAGQHRVERTPAGRQSAVFALRPCLAHPTRLEAFGGTAGHVVATQEYYRAIQGSKWSVNATRDIRERQQQDHARRKREWEARREGRAGGVPAGDELAGQGGIGCVDKR